MYTWCIGTAAARAAASAKDDHPARRTAGLGPSEQAAGKIKSPSPAAIAWMLLQCCGKTVEAGQRVPLIFIRGEARGWAWDQPEPFQPEWIDFAENRKLLLRAASDVFQPFGISEQNLHLRMEGNAAILPRPFRDTKQGQRIKAYS